MLDLEFTSNNIRQELSFFVKHNAAETVQVRCFQNSQKLQSWFSVKASFNPYNVASMFERSCDASCIGPTQRTL